MPNSHHKLHVAPEVKTPIGAKIGIVVVALAVAGTLWYLNRGSASTKAAQALAREDAKPMVTKTGQRGTVTLEDSTVVSMGASTVVKLTSHFPQDFRAVQVTGTASFKAPAGKTPLLVQTGGAWLVASDADFVVRHFADDSTAMIKVIRGKLTVRGGVAERSLDAGGTLQVSTDGAYFELPADQATEAFSWVDGNFTVLNKPLSAVLLAMKRWYNVDMVARDSSIARRPITMTASLESSGSAVDSLEQNGHVKHAFEGKGMVLTDAPEGPAKPAKKGKKK